MVRLTLTFDEFVSSIKYMLSCDEFARWSQPERHNAYKAYRWSGRMTGKKIINVKQIKESLK